MDELEDLLRRHRPSGPPPGLRARIVSAAEEGRVQPVMAAASVRRWLPAVAAALIAVVFSMLTSGIRRDLPGQLESGAPSREAVVSELAASLGDGPAAREEAERLLQLDELRARAEPREDSARDREVNNRD